MASPQVKRYNTSEALPRSDLEDQELLLFPAGVFTDEIYQNEIETQFLFIGTRLTLGISFFGPCCKILLPRTLPAARGRKLRLWDETVLMGLNPSTGTL